MSVGSKIFRQLQTHGFEVIEDGDNEYLEASVTEPKSGKTGIVIVHSSSRVAVPKDFRKRHTPSSLLTALNRGELRVTEEWKAPFIARARKLASSLRDELTQAVKKRRSEAEILALIEKAVREVGTIDHLLGRHFV